MTFKKYLDNEHNGGSLYLTEYECLVFKNIYEKVLSFETQVLEIMDKHYISDTQLSVDSSIVDHYKKLLYDAIESAIEYNKSIASPQSAPQK